MDSVTDPLEDPQEAEDEFPASELGADDLASSDGNSEDAESPGQIRRILEELAEDQSAALVYIDRRSSVTFSRDAHIKGDVVGGDQRKHGAIAGAVAASEVIAGYVAENEIGKARSVYVPPSCHDRALATLAEHHLVILVGPARWGKWTAALWLLQDAGAVPIAEVGPDVADDQLLGMDIDEGVGYVADTLPIETIRALGTRGLGRLAARLQSAGSHMVITATRRDSLAASDPALHVVSWDALPDPVRVLETRIGSREDEALQGVMREHLEHQEVLRLLQGQLVPSEADHLAELLFHVAQGEIELEEGLSRFRLRTKALLENWFRANHQPDQQAFMIATAVFNGSEFDTIAEASEQLSLRIKKLHGEAVPGPAKGPPKPRSLRLEEIHARIMESSKTTEFGSCPIELVLLNNPADQPCVLRYVWEELDWLRAPLLEWLDSLCGLPNAMDRAKVAAAVGELCRLDFARIVPRAVRSWADHADPRIRAAAALALGIPAWDSSHAPRVMRLLHHWASLDSNWRLSWTAVVAYGGLAGQRFPSVALRELLRLAGGSDARLRSAAVSGLLRLVTSTEGEIGACLELLSALLGEVAEGRGVAATRALEVFVELLQVDRRKPASSESRARAVLMDAALRDSRCLRLVVSLWRQALDTKAVRSDALGLLRVQVERSGNSPALAGVLEQIVIEVVADGSAREKTRLQHYLGKWAAGNTSRSGVAKRLLRAIELDHPGRTVQHYDER